MNSRVRFVALVLVMGLIGYGLFSLGHRVDTLGTQLEESRADRRDLHAKIDDERAAAQALREQVERLGGKPVVEPGETPPTPTILGPTQAQVNNAVSVICGGVRSPCAPTEAQVESTLRAICGDCRGEDAEPPEDGKDAPAVTAEQIDAAVARNCGEDGCRGPGPTDEQVDERLAAYCSQRNDCKGESVKGDKGEPGSVTPGDYACPDGEYVTKISVTAEGSMVLACSSPFPVGQP